MLLRPPVRSPTDTAPLPRYRCTWRMQSWDRRYHRKTRYFAFAQEAGRDPWMFVRYSIQGGHRVIAAHPVQSTVLITAGCSFRFGLGLNDQDTRPWHLQDVCRTTRHQHGRDRPGTDGRRTRRDGIEGPVRLVVLSFGDFHIERNEHAGEGDGIRGPEAW